jgi:hypothetical protein
MGDIKTILDVPLNGVYLYPCFDPDRSHTDLYKLFSLTFHPIPNTLYSTIEFRVEAEVPHGTLFYPDSENPEAKPQPIMLSTPHTPHKIGFCLNALVGLDQYGGDKTVQYPALLLAGYKLDDMQPVITTFTYLSTYKPKPVGTSWAVLTIDREALAADLLLNHDKDKSSARHLSQRLARIHRVQTDFMRWLEQERENIFRLLPVPEL